MSAIPVITSVLVAGAGSIGIGVARSFASAGFRTAILSRSPQRLESRVPEHVLLIDKLPTDPPDLIIESIPEDTALKRDFFTRVEDAWEGLPVIATNTSSLPLDELSATLRYPDRFLGTHYLYPADTMVFVEVMRASTTAPWVMDSVCVALERCGKTPIRINRPVMGALINRLQHALLREAYDLIGEGIVTAEQVDDVARRLLAPRMCVTGLLEQKDISGLDTHAAAQRVLLPHLRNSAQPTPYLQERVANGDLGLKSGRGFYDWSDIDPAKVRALTTSKVSQISEFMQSIGVGKGRCLPK
jgi:3-hydroxybutyryl-CoA dehydrogenase